MQAAGGLQGGFLRGKTFGEQSNIFRLMGAMPTFVVGMLWRFQAFLMPGAMPTLAVGMLQCFLRFPHAHGKRGHGTQIRWRGASAAPAAKRCNSSFSIRPIFVVKGRFQPTTGRPWRNRSIEAAASLPSATLRTARPLERTALPAAKTPGVSV